MRFALLLSNNIAARLNVIEHVTFSSITRINISILQECKYYNHAYLIVRIQLCYKQTIVLSYQNQSKQNQQQTRRKWQIQQVKLSTDIISLHHMSLPPWLHGNNSSFRWGITAVVLM